MSLFPDTRFNEWTRQDVASFSKRYFEPLWRSALLDFHRIDASLAQDLAQAFLLRELQRTPVLELYAPSGRHTAKFRTYLRTCFYRFARDELEKEQRRRGLSLEALPALPSPSSTREFDRLVARDLLHTLRERIVSSPPLAPDARRYFDLKWPASPEEASASDAETARELALSRGKLRTLKKKVVARILLEIRRQIHEEGLRAQEADRALEGYLCILGDEDAAGETP